MKSIIISIILLIVLIYCGDLSSSNNVPDSGKAQYDGCVKTDSINVVIRLFTTGISIPPYELDDYRNITGTIEDTVFWVYPNDSTRNIPLVRHRGKNVVMHSYKSGFFDKLIKLCKLVYSNADTVVSSKHVRHNYKINMLVDYYYDGEVGRSLFIANDFYCIYKEGDIISVARDKLLTDQVKKVFKDYRLHIIEYDKTD